MITDNVPRVVIAPDVRIRQVLNNGLTNAAKFTTEGYIELSMALSASRPNTLRMEVQLVNGCTRHGVPAACA